MRPVDQTRWWTLRDYLLEPRLLRRYVIVGLFFVATGFLSAAAAWRWICHEQRAMWKTESRCACQLLKGDEKSLEVARQIKESQERFKSFQQALHDKTSPFYAVAREGLQKESEITEKLRSTGVGVESLREFSVGLFLLLVPTVLFSWAAGRLMIAHACGTNTRQIGGMKLSDWNRPYWAFVILPFIVNELRELKTSVWDIDKSWLGWGSFCVCPVAWLLLTTVMALGVFMVIAYPASIMWCLTRTSSCPSTLDPDANDGNWGVGSYVLFLQTWSIAMLVFLLIPALIWIRIVGDTGRLSLAYLATGATLFSIAFVLEGRLIWNAIRIRLQYHNALRRLGDSWSSIQEKDPPEDPTKSFLGERWWSLPATIFGTLAALWAFIEWSGVSKLVEEFISKAVR